MKEPKKFLIINPFGIGDVLFTTPVVKAVKDNYPDSKLAYWCNERVRGILQHNPCIDKIFALSRGDLKKLFRESKLKGTRAFLNLLGAIKKEKFDISLDFSLDHRYSLLLRILGIPKLVGLDYKNRGRFLTDKIKTEGFCDKHVVEHYLETLRIFNIKINGLPKIELFSSKKDDAWADSFLKINCVADSDLVIGIAPAGGASWGANALYLRWAQSKFAALTDKVIDTYRAKVILFGSQDEVEVCSGIEDVLKNKVINTAGKITLSQFAGLLKKCRVVICNDAGPLHMAVGLGVKTVCVCGPVDERVYGPYPISQDNIVVKKDVYCRPCYKNFRFPGCSNSHRCMKDIEVNEVYETLVKLL